MEPPAITIPLTPQQKYRQSDKCKLARERYYANKGKTKAHEYYEKHKETILNRSKERYNQIKNTMVQNNLGNDLIV
jgi:hypothetical protein